MSRYGKHVAWARPQRCGLLTKLPPTMTCFRSEWSESAHAPHGRRRVQFHNSRSADRARCSPLRYQLQ